MNPDVTVAVLSLVGTLGGTFGGILTTSKLTNYRLKQLEEKQDKHNQVIERVYELEKKQAVTHEDIKVINHRIEDLEKGE